MVSYNQYKLMLDEDRSREGVISKIRELKGQVVVNIVNDPKAAPVFFSAENLDAALSFKKNALILETLPEEQYRKLMIKEIQMVSESSERLHVLLRDHFFDDIKEMAKRFLDQFQNVALLLSCYALQKPQSVFVKNMDSLKTLFTQLEADCFTYRDNVRLMDDLQYGVVPALQTIIKEMQDK